MATSVGALKPVSGIFSVFKSNKDGIVTASNGEKLLAKGWTQDAAGVVSKGTRKRDAMLRHPYATGAGVTAAGLGLAYASGALSNPASSADSFQRTGE